MYYSVMLHWSNSFGCYMNRYADGWCTHAIIIIIVIWNMQIHSHFSRAPQQGDMKGFTWPMQLLYIWHYRHCSSVKPWKQSWNQTLSFYERGLSAGMLTWTKSLACQTDMSWRPRAWMQLKRSTSCLLCFTWLSSHHSRTRCVSQSKSVYIGS